ncbi:MAG: 16S rRNA (uracil(1498)-N(3))-methyltransferase [Oscillospiraceae bacterium]|nr:16S rRNA (uracil(1498)-N(3))-methyltransferase [Oscillospiraceae bacterium]
MDLISLKFPRFFVNEKLMVGGETGIFGDDAKHISDVLRMKAGEKVVLCDGLGCDYPSEIISIDKNKIEFKVLEKRDNDSEPKIYIRLFQCVPKLEKLDFIVQKATELGVSEIIPVISKRCVSRPNNSKFNKLLRLQKIAENAAKQSGRGIIPKVHGFTEFKSALELYKTGNLGIIFYENGGARINDILKLKGIRELSVDIFIGSEGGFEYGEIEAAEGKGFITASLGKLILRAETAPIAAISIIMNLAGEI